MKIKPQIIIILASLFALATAFYAQEIMKLPPCEMCIWQRWAYVAVIFFALLSLRTTNRSEAIQSGLLCRYAPRNDVILIISLLAVLTLSAFHFGVEQKWWKGLTACSSSFNAGSMEELKAQIMAAPVVRCDAAVPFLFGLSMVAWSVLYSLALNIYAIKSLLNRRRAG